MGSRLQFDVDMDVSKSHSSLGTTVLPYKEYLLLLKILLVAYKSLFHIRVGEASECGSLSACVHE